MLKSIFVYVHLLLTCLTLGMVIYTDWCLFRERKEFISGFVRHLLQEMRSFFVYALAGLWITGIALVAMGYINEGMVYLQDEKLQAKIVVIVILTLNAVALHKTVFPILDQTDSFGRLPLQHKILLLTLGSISSGSWSFAAYLGIARFMSYTFSIGSVLLIYATWLLLVICGSFMASSLIDVSKCKAWLKYLSVLPVPPLDGPKLPDEANKRAG